MGKGNFTSSENASGRWVVLLNEQPLAECKDGP